MKKQLGYIPSTEPHYSTKTKIKTWFYYYKWPLVIGIVALLIFAPMFKDALGIGVTRPDYKFACITESGITEETASELTAALEEMGRDLNGDGVVSVQLTQFRTGNGGQEAMEMYAYASTIAAIADMQAEESHFFLFQNPEAFQQAYQILADEDGKLPEDEDYSADGRFFPCSDLNLNLSEEARQELSELYIGQRGYTHEERIEHLQAYRELWEAIKG